MADVGSAELIESWWGTLTEGQRARLAEIQVLGGEFAVSPSSRSWAVLLFAVGNLKRSAGNIHPPAFASLEDRPDGVSATVEGVPGLDGQSLSRDDADSWVAVASTRGLGAATTSMVLAAIWPEHHATFDRLTRHVAAALLGPLGEDPAPPQVSWGAYADWYLPRMREATDDVPLWRLEQAMFAAGGRMLSGPDGIPWPHEGGWSGWLTDAAAQWHNGPGDPSG